MNCNLPHVLCIHGNHFSIIMLKRLEISNYAIIDRLNILFGPAFNILTGETGAGKSIIVGALGLLLGERISGSILRKGAREGYVEGEFDFSQYSSLITGRKGTDKTSERMVVKRIFTESRGSKCFINGESASVKTIKDTMRRLVDFHGQHQHQSLLNPENYYEILDRFGDSFLLAQNVSEAFTSLNLLLKEKRVLEQQSESIKEMRDYLSFQLKEINEVDPQAGEEDELEREWKILQNAEKIISIARDCYRILYDEDRSAYEQIRQSLQSLDEILEYDPAVKSIEQDLSAAFVCVEEAAQNFQKLSERIESNPERLEEINQRLAALRQLQKKHKTTFEGIQAKKAEIEKSLTGEAGLSAKIISLSDTIDKKLLIFKDACNDLSKSRGKAAGKLQKEVLNKLKVLGMGSSALDIAVTQRKKRDRSDGHLSVTINGNEFAGDIHGIDDIQFRIATGKAERLLPIAEIASGGELSRLMLAIKSVLMQADSVPILIFDEVDTGISGRIASAVGRELRNLANVHQILCITHLPQIAAQADFHFSVDKIERENRVITRVVRLDKEKRKHEIAKLLAGETVQEVHIKNAEEMISDRLS